MKDENRNCGNCRFYYGNECRLNPVAVPIAAPSWWCGQHRDAVSAFSHAPEKIGDEQIMDAIRGMPMGFLPLPAGFDLLATQFACSRRTLDERIKRLAKIQKLAIYRNEAGRRDSVTLHPSVEDWDGWAEDCAKKGIAPQTIWKAMEEKGLLPPGATHAQAANRKWTYADHLAPLLGDSIDTAERYSRLAERAWDAYKMNRPAFNRTLMNAVNAGQILRTEKGGYFRAPLPA